jgi:hypothetical protein
MAKIFRSAFPAHQLTTCFEVAIHGTSGQGSEKEEPYVHFSVFSGPRPQFLAPISPLADFARPNPASRP